MVYDARRMISLSNRSDDRMRRPSQAPGTTLTDSERWPTTAQCTQKSRTSKCSKSEMKALYESFSGERGIFNREACTKKIGAYGKRDPNHEWGGNPCLEVTLTTGQACATCRRSSSVRTTRWHR